MSALWTVSENYLEIDKMPFYWRLSDKLLIDEEIDSHLAIRITSDDQKDFLKFIPNQYQWSVINKAYQKNVNIGFLNPESGQMQTYGASFNNFILNELKKFNPKNPIEIGCGAGFTIKYVGQHGFNVLGVDPSEYSLNWSQKLNFELINDYFSEEIIQNRCKPDFIYCNDVFEHVLDVENFASMVFNCLNKNGVFCISTTNSTDSIKVGDLSMLEHQHVNMFTTRSIYLILYSAGFSNITISNGTYGNTFHITAIKNENENDKNIKELIKNTPPICSNFFKKSYENIKKFENFYNRQEINCYVPLRSIPYLSCVGDFGKTNIFDSNNSWRGKYIDGYTKSIGNFDDCIIESNKEVFIGSLTFYNEIKNNLIKNGYEDSRINSILTI